MQNILNDNYVDEQQNGFMAPNMPKENNASDNYPVNSFFGVAGREAPRVHVYQGKLLTRAWSDIRVGYLVPKLNTREPGSFLKLNIVFSVI